ncbi:MAG: hypothetical protein QG620_645 [Patescibacteria group bacterium]|nr:hypothetical protein [Patescibacteria group bacterium]
MNGKIRKYCFLAIITLLFVLSGNLTYAEDADMVEITLDPSGAFGPSFIIDESNILPGDKFSRKIIITNKTPDQRLVMLRLDSNSYLDFNTGLESEILVEIKRSGGELVDFPFLPGTTLRNLYDETAARNFDILGSGDSQSYEIFFVFDPLATDQSKSRTRFDLSLGVESDVYNPPILRVTSDSNDDDDDDDDNDGGGGRRGGGIADLAGALFSPVEGADGEDEENNQGGGEEVRGEESSNGETSGAEDAVCQGWPKWVWILALVVFVLGLFLEARRNYLKIQFGWKTALAWTGAAAAFWYFFDKCREYQWFLYGAIILAIVSHLVYLWMLKKKIKKPGAESGE